MIEPGKFTYRYPRPMVTVDALLYTPGPQRQVLLIKRAKDPFSSYWALPGGFVEIDETLEEAVMRELKEETGVEKVSLTQMHTFSAVDRDPRGRSISTVFWGETDPDLHDPAGADDADEARWWPMEKPPPMAFDHAEILAWAAERLGDGEHP
ncbi:MAG: hypothetical protein RLZZ303_1106 [Candidatus Hydrogenedentota bacterium]|jgi:8-oxo-dGTP diphosphatase